MAKRIIFTETKREIVPGDFITLKDSGRLFKVLASNSGRVGHKLTVTPAEGSSDKLGAREAYYNCFVGLEIGRPAGERTLEELSEL